MVEAERNWKGPVLANAAIVTTVQQFQAMERAATPQDKLNWRFQQALYRAYYDAHVRSRLLDERTIGALLDVRGRGFDVAVIELDPVGLVEPRRDERGELAHRLWLLQRSALRDRFRGAGIPIATWNRERPLESALEEVRASRRRVARVRA